MNQVLRNVTFWISIPNRNVNIFISFTHSCSNAIRERHLTIKKLNNVSMILKRVEYSEIKFIDTKIRLYSNILLNNNQNVDKIYE